ncbi:hypothetical protein DL96DRAFT_1717814 [Flagelloscypha sp. PMI_526]|nr:hypothetical protein DL96DRAFT_1717814 [Flagelloscypha sp. PMI_526]
MTASAPTIDPRLPPELERQIFELTVRWDARSYFPLLLVAHRVRSCFRFPLEKYSLHPLGLSKYLPRKASNSHFEHLQELTNLHSFTTRGTGLLGPSIPSLLSLRLRRLALGRADTIQLLFRISNLLPKELQEFQLLNTLTHLHVPFFLGTSINTQILETLLSSEQTAAIVFRVFTDRENGSDLATKAFLERNGLRDERIVMIPEVMLVIGKSADVKEDIWRRAEKMIASKRKPAESSVDSIQKFLDSAKI